MLESLYSSPAEEVAALAGETRRSRRSEPKAQAVPQDHAAQQGVEGQDQEGGDDRHVANEGVLFGQSGIGAAGPLAGFTAPGQTRPA